MGLYGAAIQQYSGCDHTAPYSRLAARSPRDLFGALAYGVAHSKRRLYGPLYGQHTLCGPHKRSMDRSTHALWTRALRNRTESGRIGRPSWPTGRPYSPYSAPSHTDHTTRNGCIIQHTAHTRPHAVWSAVTIQHTAHTAILPYSQPSAAHVCTAEATSAATLCSLEMHPPNLTFNSAWSPGPQPRLAIVISVSGGVIAMALPPQM